jgi:hypothetical protein
METEPRQPKSGRIYAIIATLLWMVVAFIAGVFVGTHPEWIPNMPWAYHPSVEDVPGTIHIPTTEPTEGNSSTTMPTVLPSTRP